MHRSVLILVGLFVLVSPASSPQRRTRQPLTLPLSCAAGGDCVLLDGDPQTDGLRSGYVRLKPGESIPWHTTSFNEEALVILQGHGTTQVEGHADIPISGKMLVYIPPFTRHRVTNSGDEVLEYVYVVAQTALK